MPTPRRITALLLAVAAILTAGCGRTINRSAERKIRDALPGYIGPARVWRAHVDNPPQDTLRGRLSRITIDGEAVHLKQTIVCETLHVEMRDAVVDTQQQRLRSVGTTLFSAAITENALNDYLARNPPPDDDPVRILHVHLTPGHVQIEATRWLLGRAWPFTVTAEPRLVSDTTLDFDPDRMTVLGLRVPLPASALRYLAHRMSQGFDFSTLPFPLHIARVQVDDSRLTLDGTADVMQSLNERIGAILPSSSLLRDRAVQTR